MNEVAICSMCGDPMPKVMANCECGAKGVEPTHHRMHCMTMMWRELCDKKVESEDRRKKIIQLQDELSDVRLLLQKMKEQISLAFKCYRPPQVFCNFCDNQIENLVTGDVFLHKEDCIVTLNDLEETA